MKHRTSPRRLVLAAAFVFAACPVWAARPLTLEQVRGYAFPELLVAATRASRIAWIYDDAGRRNVWVAEGDKFEARQLTHYSEDDGQEISSLSLSADGPRVVYVRGGEHGANWDPGLPVNVLSNPAGTKVEVWSVEFSGGDPRLIGEGDYPVVSPDGRRVAFLKENALWGASLEGDPQAKKLLNIRGKTSSPVWSPDGTRIAFVSSRETHAFIGIFSDEKTPIFWVSPSTSRDDAPRWSPDGKRIAFVRRAGQGGTPAALLKFEPHSWEIWVADAATGEASRRWASTLAVDDSQWGVYLEWGAGGRLVFQSYQDSWPHLYSLPQSGEPLQLTQGKFAVDEFTLSPDRKYLVYNANTGKDARDTERRHLYKVSVAEGHPRQLTSGAGLEWTPAVTADDRIALISATAQRPPAPAILGKEGGAIRLLTPSPTPADYPADQLIVPTPVTFKSADGLTVHGELFMPTVRAQKHPAIVYLHGGPQRQMLLGWHPMGYYSNDYALNQYLASRGFVVLAVNYRLGVAYGHDFNFPPNAGERGASEYQDVQAGAHYLQSLASVDPKRVGIYGGSYGGYLTALALARDSSIFAAGVDIHGVHDWVTDIDMTSLSRMNRYEMPVDFKQAVDTAWASSPVASIGQWKSPVLLIHGDDDRNVQIAQTVDLAQRLRGTGVHYEQLLLVDETHSIQRYANVLRMNRATAEFLERFLAAPRP